MKMNFKSTLLTTNQTPGINEDKFIIYHHTATQEGTIKGVLNTLTKGTVSAHFVIDTNGDTYKINTPEDILWHAGESSWGNLTDMNKYSIGIEVVGPLSNGRFTDLQRRALKELTIHLMQNYKIPVQNVLRHKDIAPKRKIDIADTLWNDEFQSFDDWKKAKLLLQNNVG